MTCHEGDAARYFHCLRLKRIMTGMNGTQLSGGPIAVTMLDFLELMSGTGEPLVDFRTSFGCLLLSSSRSEQVLDAGDGLQLSAIHEWHLFLSCRSDVFSAAYFWTSIGSAVNSLSISEIHFLAAVT